MIRHIGLAVKNHDEPAIMVWKADDEMEHSLMTGDKSDKVDWKVKPFTMHVQEDWLVASPAIMKAINALTDEYRSDIDLILNSMAIAVGNMGLMSFSPAIERHHRFFNIPIAGEKDPLCVPCVTGILDEAVKEGKMTVYQVLTSIVRVITGKKRRDSLRSLHSPLKPKPTIDDVLGGILKNALDTMEGEDRSKWN